MPRHARPALQILLTLPVLLLASCSAPGRHPAVPAELADRAVIFNDPSLRSWDDSLNEAFATRLFRAGLAEIDTARAEHPGAALPPAHYLAISGGGPDGAYGAGILCGWTAAGTRPQFKIVTGISTGALTAPFAFLGSSYDDRLKKVYTTVTTSQIARKRSILAAVYNDAMMTTEPLRSLMAETVDDEMIRAIAAEYAKGRLLLVATTNLDASRGVIWNIGAIAAIGTPEARELIYNVLIASAAIPAAFPPVMFDVEVDGKAYEEMHVDGGAMAQVFLYPPTLHLEEQTRAAGVERERIAYIIRNSRLDPKWADVKRETLDIAGRAIDALIQTQGVGDLYRIYITSQRDNVDFNLAFIPSSFTEKPEEAFDPAYMTKLFEVGYQQAITSGGYPWHKSPPGFEAAPRATAPVASP